MENPEADHTAAGQGQSAPRRLLSSIPTIPFAIFALIVVFFLYQIVGGLLTFFIMGEMISQENVVTARWLTLFGQIILILVPTILLTAARGKPGEILRVGPVRLPEVILVLAAILSLQQVFQGYMVVQEMIPLPDTITRFIEPFKEMIEETYRILVTARTLPEFLMIVMVIAVVPAFAEEFLFRGLVQHHLSGPFGPFRAAIVTGFVFAAYHLNPFTFVPLAGLGVYFGYLVYRKGSLSLAVIAHFANNFFAAGTVYAGFGEEALLLAPGAAPGTAAVLGNSALFLGIFILCHAAFVRMTRPAGTGTDRD